MAHPPFSAGAVLALMISLIPGAAGAQDVSPSPFQAAYLQRFRTGVDGGGHVTSDRFDVGGGYPLLRSEGGFVGITGRYRLHAYEFSGGAPGSFAGMDPWDEVHTFRLGAPVLWKFREDWTLLALPSLRWSGESGASFDDSFSGGVLAGGAYRFSDRLSIGPGLGVLSQLEDDPSVFPFLLVDWKITDALSLTTRPTGGATEGPGLALNWEVDDKWRLSIGVRYEKLRFRLDDGSSVSPGGIGEDRSIPIYGALSYRFHEHWTAALLGGVNVGGRLRLENASGDKLQESDYDAAPFLGASLSLKF